MKRRKKKKRKDHVELVVARADVQGRGNPPHWASSPSTTIFGSQVDSQSG